MAEFEERADQLSTEEIDKQLAAGQIFQRAQRKLLAPGAKLLVGPRGTGKTHLMRHTYQHAIREVSEPLVLYATFNRYLNLEPLLNKSPDALKRFHSWVLAKLLLSCFDLVLLHGDSPEGLSELSPQMNSAKLAELVSLLERGSGSEIYESFGQYLTVADVISAVRGLCKRYKRSRAVLLLDDAALSLTEHYLVAFFEVYRLLKTEDIAPKASVYPGSTQYGPTFHASHEVEEIPLWLSVEDSEYLSIMGDIGTRRLSAEDVSRINSDILDLLKYCAFGVPRVYLRMLREYLDQPGSTAQQRINKIIEHQTELIQAEYDSLGMKLPQFGSLVAVGRRFFEKSVLAVALSQIQGDGGDGSGTRNIVLGVRQDSDRNPLVERMIKFLVEVGMLYPLQAVSHGPNRKYDRFIPHVAFLQQQGLFREGRGSSVKDVAAYMRRPPAKHPIRRELVTLLSKDELGGLKLDLPSCQRCGATRINESQRFCHNCGAELVAASLFEQCMKLPLKQVPGISAAILKRIHDDTRIRTIGHVLASQNASLDLQQASYVGPVRADGIIRKVAITVEEFMS